MYANILGVLAKAQRPFVKSDFVDPLASIYSLSDKEVEEMYDSGNGPVFVDRITWALSYLNMADCMDKPKRGYYQLSEEGKSLVGKSNAEIKELVNLRFHERTALKAATPSTEKGVEVPATTVHVAPSDNPQEELNDAFARLREFTHEDLLTTIRSKAPIEFERLVVKLLQAMGYGGEIANSGSVTQYGNDGGIDGIIKEDVLGFGRIYIQAKRYAANMTIGRPDLQAFVGALAGVGASKGIFITTSRFSQGAVDFAESLSTGTKVILMDGDQLAKHLYNYGVGMQVEETIVIKTLDSDFWDEMRNDS